MEEEEGDYMAALRGSKSKQWQAKQAAGGGGAISNSYYPDNLQNPASAGSNCFRCGQLGHWSRDCPMPQVPGGGSPAGNPTNPALQKQCPCGGGLCIVRTSNTPKNPGRQFFVCPKPSEAGKCNFFEWCDAAPAQTTPVAVNTPEPELKCPSCGQPCAVLTAKTEKNNGRRFYKCQRTEGCNLFKWCDELNASPGSKPSRTSYGGSEAYGGGGYGGGGYGDYRGSAYGDYCGGGGGYGGGGYGRPSYQGGGAAPPWMPTGDPAATNKPAKACFKCGDPGHWANACPVGR